MASRLFTSDDCCSTCRDNGLKGHLTLSDLCLFQGTQSFHLVAVILRCHQILHIDLEFMIQQRLEENHSK